ncbi:hypothetical protein BDA99DRAFT_306055 [Phascolomyces articulosus]|uniref:SEC7 domain-containing protein n=1 Tax=Phascolomyces articulosus TaxID=60185 RepID=A0AAD5KIG4_9FUNG|nr:hypothetical protein BDA99DRAFT_306055 [Phascolomyces articulosus]
MHEDNNKNNHHLPLSNSRQMTGVSLNQCLDDDLRGLTEEEFRGPINAKDGDNVGHLLATSTPTNTVHNHRNSEDDTTKTKIKVIKKKQRPLSLPRSFIILNFDHRHHQQQQQKTKKVTSKGSNNNKSKTHNRRRHSLTRSLSMLIRRLRPSLRRNKKSKSNDTDSIFTFAGKSSEEQRFVDNNNNIHHQNISNNNNVNMTFRCENSNNNNHQNHDPGIISIAPPLLNEENKENKHNRYYSSSSSIQHQGISREYSASCTSGTKTTTDNNTVVTAATMISDSSLVDKTSLFSKRQSYVETNNLVDSVPAVNNNSYNNNKQYHLLQQTINKRESRSSSIISRAPSRSTITVNSIYNTFARDDDDDAFSSLFELSQNNRSHARLSVCSSKFSLACVTSCIDGKQQQYQQQQIDLPQNNNNSSNMDGTAQEKQQAITNRDDPNERRLSRPSSTLIHHYSLSYYDDDNIHQENHYNTNENNLPAGTMMTNNNDKNNDDGDDGTDDQAAAEYVKLTAERLWNEDEGICERERIAEWLGTNDRFRSSVLKYYMNHFDFTDQRIDESFRILCSKMYFKAEAQQIDRILEVFASRYWDCNPSTIMKNHDIIHAVSYSLLLLNTDLHCAHENHKKMTRSKFIRNTMDTIHDLAKVTDTTTSITITHPTVTTAFGNDNTNNNCTPTNNQDPDKIAATTRLKGFLPISESVFSVLSSASSASSRWMLRRSISSKSFGSIIPTPPSPKQQQPCSEKKDSIPTSIKKGGLLGNNQNNENTAKCTQIAGLVDSQEMWSEEMENLLKDIYLSVKVRQIIKNDISGEQKQKQQCPDENENVPDGSAAKVEGMEVTKDQEDKKTVILRRRRGQSLLSPLAGLSGALDDISLVKQKRRLSHSPTDPSIYALDKNIFTSATAAAVNEHSNTSIKMCKEGIVMQKHVMEYATKKARHRGWQPCFLIVREGKADLCRPRSTTKEQKRKSLWGNQHKNSHIHDFYHQYETNILYSNSKKDQAELIQSIDLKHSLANTLPPPGWNGERQFVFSLQAADGAVWLFESVDLESTLAWVTCCNYWAALLSKEALPGAVCNLDYGWTTVTHNLLENNENKDEDDKYTERNDDKTATVGISPSSSSTLSQQQDNPDNVMISDWVPPSPSMITSQVSEADKILALGKHLTFLQLEIKEHRASRETIYNRFAGRNHKEADTKKLKALDNWEQKMQYLLHEVIKYRTYDEALKCSPSAYRSDDS